MFSHLVHLLLTKPIFFLLTIEEGLRRFFLHYGNCAYVTVYIDKMETDVSNGLSLHLCPGLNTW